MKLKLTIFLLISSAFLTALSLQDCISNLEKNYPTSENEQLYNAIGREEISQLNKNWLPQLFITGSASYSSETTNIKLDLPPTFNVSFPEAEKDRESLSLEISQKIFDSGITTKQKEMKRLKNLVDITSHQASMHQKKMLTASLYLSVVLLDKTNRIMDLQLQELKITKKILNARLDEGLLEDSDVQKIQYEILNLQDKQDEIRSNRAGLIYYLSLLTGMQITDNAVFDVPTEPDTNNAEIERLELKGFDFQKQLLSASQKLNARSLWPQLFAGGNLSYGKPGYDMFSNDYHEYYSVGLNLRWQIWDFGKTRNENRIVDQKKKLIQNQKAEFELNLQNKLAENSRKISLLNDKLKRSQQKVELMTSIEQSVKAKLAEGVVTSDDYLLQSNKLLKTKTELEQDRLNLLNAEIQKVLLRGGEI